MANMELLQPHVVNDNGASGSGFRNQQLESQVLYVANLDQNVTDEQLWQLFIKVIPVDMVHVCKDYSTRQSLGYGYVYCFSPQDAATAMKVLNLTSVNGKSIRITYSHKQERELAVDKSKFTNVFVKNLSKSTTDEDLNKVFSEYGTITSGVVMKDAEGNSKCFGFVNFENADDAAKAVDALNGQKFDAKKWYVGKFLSKKEREQELQQRVKQTVEEAVDLDINNLDETVSDENLKELFAHFGTLTYYKVMLDLNGRSKGSGFVSYSTSEEASRALSETNGKIFGTKPLNVTFAQQKGDRMQTMKESVDKTLRRKMYIKHLNVTTSDEELKELLVPFGTIISCKVNRNPDGTSLGSAYVLFSTSEEASRAHMEMKGKVMNGLKPLFIAVYQGFEDSRENFQAQASQMHPIAMAPTGAPCGPM